MRQPIQVLVYPVYLSSHENSVLLLKRTPNLGSFWQGVTGAPEAGETLLEAAARELFEETQFTVPSIEKIDFTYSFPVPSEFADAYDPIVQEINEFVFFTKLDSRHQPVLSYEHEDWRWCTFAEGLRLLKWPGNIEALKRCESILIDHA